MLLLVHCARQHEQRDLIDARHRLEARLAETRTRLRQMTALEMRLRERCVVITPKGQIAECIVPLHKFNQVFVDCIVFLAAPQPVGKRLLWDQTSEKVILLALTARQAFDLLLVSQEGIAEDVRPIAAVVFRLLVTRRLTRARCPHDGAEHIERCLWMSALQLLETRRTRENLIARIGVLA